MLFTEFNIDDAKRIWQEEAPERGIERGKAEGFNEAVIKMLKKGVPPQQIADYMELPLEKVVALKNN